MRRDIDVREIRACLLLAFVASLIAKPGCAPISSRGLGDAGDLFDQGNLFAWCIVPFDGKKRGPEERAAMLERLGIRALAYDYRAEHVPQFDEEVEALSRHGIRLLAWWFPQTLDAEAQRILEVLRRHEIKAQLWVSGGGEEVHGEREQRARVEEEASRVRPIAKAAAAIGCTVGLYNHGGWFGEPENQIAVIEALRAQNITNVGIVYNLHHGHGHVDRFAELMQKMKPDLLALNLNGMVREGDKSGRKILPLSQGDLDFEVLRIVRDSGWRGPVGILNHSDEDAEARLLDNLEGLEWLKRQLEGRPPGRKPSPSTWQEIPIAVFVPMSGDFAEFGLTEFHAAQMAVQEFEQSTASNGLLLRLVVRDTEHSPQKAEALFEEVMAETPFQFCYVASSGCALELAPRAEKRGVLLLSDAASPLVTQNCSLAFRHTPDARDECAAIVRDAIEYRGATKLALLHVESAYGRAYPEPFQAEVRRRGCAMVGLAGFEASSTPFTSLVTNALESGPDAVVVIGFGPSLARLIEEIRRRRFPGHLYAAPSVAYPGTRDVAPAAIEGVLYPEIRFDVGSSTFARRWKERFGADPSPLAASTYDAFTLLFGALSNVGPDPVRVRDELLAGAAHEGATGKIHLHPERHFSFPLEILRVENGRGVRTVPAPDLDPSEQLEALGYEKTEEPRVPASPSSKDDDSSSE